MAFQYNSRSKYSTLFDDTIQLLEQIDAFEYDVLKPKYSTLGELHDTLTVEVCERLDNYKKYIERISIADIKARIDELKKEKKPIEEHNKKLRERIRIEGNPNLENLWKHFPGESELCRLKEVLEENEHQPDDYVVEIEWENHRSGYYTRTEDDAEIVLEFSWTELVTTYIHEMMHAFYDSERLNESPNSIEYVEEPLAEYGMLHFLSAFVQGNPQHEDLLKYAIKAVNTKQHSVGLYHYAFGEYLYQNYSHIEWEKLMLDAINKVDVNTSDYKSLQAIFQARPKKNNQDKAAQLLYDILTKANGMPAEKIAKQNRTKTTKRTKNTQQQSKQPLNIDEETYSRWLKRYQEEGVLPSEEEMDEAIGNSSMPSVTSKTSGPSKVIVEYQEPYQSFGASYKVHLEYDYSKDELQYLIKDPLRGLSKKLSNDEIRTIKTYLKNRQNIEDFFQQAYDTPPVYLSHILVHELSIEYGDRSKKVENGELMPWAEPFDKLC